MPSHHPVPRPQHSGYGLFGGEKYSEILCSTFAHLLFSYLNMTVYQPVLLQLCRLRTMEMEHHNELDSGHEGDSEEERSVPYLFPNDEPIRYTLQVFPQSGVVSSRVTRIQNTKWLYLVTLK